MSKVLLNHLSTTTPQFYSNFRPRFKKSTHLLQPDHHRFNRKPANSLKISYRNFTVCLAMESAVEEEYASQSKLLQEFTNIPMIDKAWSFKSKNGTGSQAMISFVQTNLLANKKRKVILSAHISKGSDDSVSFNWAPFPVEMTNASLIVPSPSGSKLLVIRNPENESPTQFEIWGPSQVEKEFHVPQSTHGSVYCDGWFEGISWNSDETLIAYVAEEPVTNKPSFNSTGYKKSSSSTDKDSSSWKGLGDLEEHWGEGYAGKKLPALFVINVDSGEVNAVKGIGNSLSVGQVVWAPQSEGLDWYLVFVGWPSDIRKLGIKHCYNRPCGIYALRYDVSGKFNDDISVLHLTKSISSGFFPRFSPDGKFLVFCSQKSSVDTGAHSATNSLHKIKWPVDANSSSSLEIIDVIPVVMCAEDGCFPGLYCSNLPSKPWLSDGQTMILSSYWRSTESIISVNVSSGDVSRISPTDSDFSWNILTLDGDNILAVCSSPVDTPQIKYGSLVNGHWHWLDIGVPISKCSGKVTSLLSSRQFSIMKIAVKDVSEDLPEGAKKPIEAIFVSSKSMKKDSCDPLVVVLHGGPHTLCVSSFNKSLAFLSSLGFSLLIVNYRGSVGFGEEALQSLLGRVGSQDVSDVLAAIDHTINLGLADPSKLTVFGGSHGGFLTTHLIGQAPDKFAAAAARNPVCNMALMVGVSDIPDWCYIESYGSEGKDFYTEAPNPEELARLYSMSPIAHLQKVKTPTLFLLGDKDLRVPVSNGLQYARTLRARGVEVKVMLFPNDTHGLDRPQTDFEGFLNIGVWFKNHCK